MGGLELILSRGSTGERGETLSLFGSVPAVVRFVVMSGDETLEARSNDMIEVGLIRRIQGIGYDVLEFLGVGTTFDIFQNIHILYLEYGVLSFSGYGVLSLFPLWSFDMALPPRDQRHQYLRYEGLQYTDDDIANFEARLARIYRREVHRVQVFDFGGLPDLMADGLSARMLMEHMDAQGVSLFTSRAWRRLFDIRGPLVHELILEFFSTFRFGEAVTDLDTAGALQFQLGGVRRRLSWRQFILALGLHTDEEMQTVGFGAYWADNARQIPDKGGLRDYWIGISSAGDFLGTTPSYTAIHDLILRLCHRLISCSIAGRSQAPEKYLRLFATGRKSGAHISGGQFVARLVEHFGLLTVEILQGLTVIAPALPVIDMAELVRLQICVEIDDTWAWVALGPERQPDAAAGAPRVAQDAPAVDEGVQTNPVPVQAPPPLPAAARTIPQRMARLEEDVHKIRGALTEQREVIDEMARDFSRFSTWAITSLARMMDRVGYRGGGGLAEEMARRWLMDSNQFKTF
ncbi:hypothetical protein Tco_0803415 [Tanacetum coccineum]|uniref:Uncharacterized protein n=1 Tax=Tanacetum coccineum TaxID=301880 RepID=A0ABQ5A5L2_9ASTR